MWVDNIFLSCHCKFNKMKDCCEKSCSSLAPFARNRRENLETVTSQSSHYKGNNSLSSCFKMGYNFNYLSDSPKCLVFAVVSLVLMNFVQLGESVPATQENLENKIKMFLESRCTSRNETLEQEEFKSFMSCGPSHGAGIIKNLGRIPEYKSSDTDRWANATKREIVSQCEIWPKDRTCQKTTFRLIEKCFEMDQKFIFYFMFALTDVICQAEQSDLFIKFWQNGGDACLGQHIKNLKKDWSECFEKTSTVSDDDVNRNFDGVLHCFRSQFDSKECFGDGGDQVLNEITEEIRMVYLETGRSSAKMTQSGPILVAVLTTFWMTFLL